MRSRTQVPLLLVSLTLACPDSGDDDASSSPTTPTMPTTPTAPMTSGTTGSSTADTPTTTDAETTAAATSMGTSTSATSLDPSTTAGPTGDDTTGPGDPTGDDTTTGVDPNDPCGGLPPANVWPPGPSDHVTPSGVPYHVEVPAGDTTASRLIIGGYAAAPIGSAVTIAVMSDGVMGPMACPMGGFGVPHNLNAMVVHEVLLDACANVRYDHKRAFVEASNNNAGWGVEATLDPMNQPFLAGVYVPWAEYNNAPCKAVNTPADANSPRTLFVVASQCDDTYCPLTDCVNKVQSLGYDVTFNDTQSPATCDCDGPCPGAIDRPHFKGYGDQSVIEPWVMATSKP